MTIELPVHRKLRQKDYKFVPKAIEWDPVFLEVC